MSTTPSDQDPILRRAVLPAARSRRKQILIVAASLGALGLASGLGFSLLGRDASARVDINIAVPAPPIPPAPTPVAPPPAPPATAVVEPAEPPVVVVANQTPGRIQVALMLDTSGSMGGL